MLDAVHRANPAVTEQALAAYQKFLSLSDGKSPNQEFQARQRVKLLEKELRR